jgi:hypothetical protein
MRPTRAPLLPASERPMTATTLSEHSLAVIAHHGENILAEIPKTLRRVATLFLVLSISIPAFFAGLLVVLWHLAH